MKVVEIAKTQIGYEEGENNNTKYGKWYGLNNNPWCAMFVSWVFHKAMLSKYIAASGAKGFASCSAGLAYFAKKNKLVPVGEAQPGDLVFFQFDDDSAPDHIGIVIRNDRLRKTLVCVEGNTSGTKSGSQSNGGGVYKKRRPYKYIMAVARPVKENHES